MRSGYFIYDLANSYIAVAQAKLNITDEAITAVPSGTSIPGCTATDTFTLAATASTSQTAPETTSAPAATDESVPSPTFALGAVTFLAGSATGTSSGAGATATTRGGCSSNFSAPSRPVAMGLGLVASVGALVASSLLFV
jgi:hypothetical protein